MRVLQVLGLLILTHIANAQNESITIAAYNLLNYPNVKPERISSLATIVQGIQPDVFLVTELNSEAGANSILSEALNVNGEDKYAAPSFINGPDSDNLIYYNTEKLGLYSRYEVATTLRNISEYVLYYKHPDLATSSDTVFLYCYMAHLKASKGSDNESQRNNEAITIKGYMSQRASKTENVIFAGDFNMYSSSEDAHQSILNYGNVKLYDPINTPGDWNNNFDFAQVHTQSTRSTNLGDGGSTGGMDDRFDIIFISDDLRTGVNHVSLVEGSYKAYGNDGLHYNKSINEAPSNKSVSSSMANALYTMSDHLPVVMEVKVNGVTSIKETKTQNWKGFEYNHQFIFEAAGAKESFKVEILNMAGQVMMTLPQVNEAKFKINLEAFPVGMYIVKVASPSNVASYKVVR